MFFGILASFILIFVSLYFWHKENESVEEYYKTLSDLENKIDQFRKDFKKDV